ncbi:MAG TPA: class I SAM-dependent methyltransferase [Chryseolinea sp.]
MTKLYTEYADLYHKMYQSFIDYDEEYQFYKALLDKHATRNILEIGCGTGQLAKRFLKDGYTYTGIDVSVPMLEYARKEMPAEHFHQMDMRSIELPRAFDGVIITARSISYILTNKDVLATFQSIKKVLQSGGVLIFDFIDAKSFIPSINEREIISHQVVIDNVTYKRDSIFEKHIDSGWNWLWRSTFFKEEENGYKEIGSDEAELRTFTADELEIFLTLSGFRILQVVDRRVYAFDTKVIVAQQYP